MKRGNLAVLLVFPFVVAFLGVTTIVGTLQRMDKDITDIEWNYDGAIGFKIGVRNPLQARQVYDVNAGLAYGNNLVWTVKNADDDPVPHAEMIEVNNGPTLPKDYYLIGRNEGDVILTVSNEKKTVSKSTRAAIYDNFALTISPDIPESHANIDPVIYYGQYDFKNGEKVAASISYPVSTIPVRSDKSLTLISHTPNIDYDLDTGLISVKSVTEKVEPASFTVSCLIDGDRNERTVDFALVKDGVNVYDYDDLLRCTNGSEQGEVVVLRKNFESMVNAVAFNADGSPMMSGGKPVAAKTQTALFGHYTGMSSSRSYYLFDFAKEAYTHVAEREKDPNANTFIQQWNDFAKSSDTYRNSLLGNEVYAGLRIQKDFYGNGYTLNLHNLTYPYAETKMQSGDVVPTLSAENLFRGPLLDYCLGDPAKFRIIALYGQDNAGLYLDADGITLNDVNVKNCDPGAHLSDLDKVGNVIDVHGDGVTIKNSVISNGKSVIRSYSNEDLTVQNCLLQNSYNFLLDIGSDLDLPIDGSAEADFIPARGGEAKPAVIDEYLETVGDVFSNTYIARDIGALSNMVETTTLGWNTVKNAIYRIGDALSGYEELSKVGYDGSVNVKDVLFYNSGVASIGSEAAFNGPFLYAQSPSLINLIFGLLSSVQLDGSAIVPKLFSGLARNSYPSLVRIQGETEFFDYKILENVDLNGLLYQELNTVIARVLSQMGDAAGSLIPEGFDLAGVDLDAIFPLKKIWAETVSDHHLSYTPAGQEAKYVNMPTFYFGGGPNLTELDVTAWEHPAAKYREYDADLLSYFSAPNKESSDRYWKLIWKLVESFIGYEPFKFGFMDGSGYNYGQAPSRDTLIAKASEVTP